jgi:hypothetical protein
MRLKVPESQKGECTHAHRGVAERYRSKDPALT